MRFRKSKSSTPLGKKFCERLNRAGTGRMKYYIICSISKKKNRCNWVAALEQSVDLKEYLFHFKGHGLPMRFFAVLPISPDGKKIKSKR
jgi:hypothetical protein